MPDKVRPRRAFRFAVLAIVASFGVGIATAGAHAEGWFRSSDSRAAPAQARSASLAVVLPSEFEDTLVTKLSGPTAVEFVPGGPMLIAAKAGYLRVWENGALRQTPALNISARVCDERARGFVGVAVDPSFATNHFIYLYYTFKKFGNCNLAPPEPSATAPVNRLSRFVLSDAGVVNPQSEVVLLDNIPSLDATHNGGDLAFGPDGYLYVTTGDGGCDYAEDSGCQATNDAARDRHSLVGKVLRITSSGGIPTDNPFRGSGTARCNATGRTDANTTCQEIYAYGLRNPWQIAFDPNVVGTRLFINDVGQFTWEEVNLGVSGADYGWNVREGHCKNGSTTVCDAPPAGLTNPIYDYAHSTGCASITGAAFVPRGVWPASYEGAYLYGDYVCGKIFKLTRTSGGAYQAEQFATGLGSSSIHTLAFGPNGTGTALFYTSSSNGGEVRRIVHTGAANRAPSAIVSATPTSGDLPLAVEFDATSSSDPDADPLTFVWNFGDGTEPTTGATVNHTYESAGEFAATVTVSDGRGGEDRASVSIDAGNAAPSPLIQAPLPSVRFRVGETLTLSGSASDLEDGSLPASSLSWTVIQHHGGNHTHVYIAPTSGDRLTFAAPAPEDLATTTNSYLELRLTATDSRGLSATVTQELRPQLVNVTLASSPAGLRLGVNEAMVVAPTTVVSWAGYQVRLAAAAQVDGSGTYRQFGSWSDGGAAAHTITTPATATTYTASFGAVSGTLFGDTFESGNLNAWSSATGLTMQQTHVYGGVWAVRATSSGAPTYALKQLATAKNELLYRVRFKLLSRAPATTVSLLRVRTAAGARLLSLNVRNSAPGTLSYRNDAVGIDRYSPQVVSLNAWHEVKLHVTVNGSASHVTVWYDGARIAALDRTELLGTTPIGQIQLGNEVTGRTYDIALDGVAVD